MTNVWSIPRNDLAAALAFYRQGKASGTLRESDVRVLAKLQDDPHVFFQAVKQEQ
jgi:hypothetical protein